MYEPNEEGGDPIMDSYQSESARSHLLGSGMGKQHRRVRPCAVSLCVSAACQRVCVQQALVAP